MTIVDAGKQLDYIRRQYELASTPQSSFYLAQCRRHDDADVAGLATVAGWRQYVSSKPEVVATQVIIIGASGT